MAKISSMDEPDETTDEVTDDDVTDDENTEDEVTNEEANDTEDESYGPKRLPRLPAEIVARIASFVPKTDRKFNKSEDRTHLKSNSLLNFACVNRDCHQIVMPFLYNDIGGEFSEIAEVFDLVKKVESHEKHLLVESIDWSDKEGHPMDWKYPTRLRWYLSHVKYISFLPQYQSDTWEKMNHSIYAFMTIQDKLELECRHPASNSLLPSLEFLSLDVFGWIPSSRRKLDGIRLRKYTREQERIHDENNVFRSGRVLARFLEFLGPVVKPKLVCLRYERISTEGVIRPINGFDCGTVVLHDPWQSHLDHGLPECSNLLFDFDPASTMMDGYYYRFNRLVDFIGDFSNIPMSIKRFMFVRQDVTDSDSLEYEFHSYSETGGDREEWFRQKMDGFMQEVKDEAEKKGLRRGLEWGFIKGETGKVRCRGCDRKSLSFDRIPQRNNSVVDPN